MPTQRPAPFLTLEDPNAKIKGSRDPLGVQPIWAAFGRHDGETNGSPNRNALALLWLAR